MENNSLKEVLLDIIKQQKDTTKKLFIVMYLLLALLLASLVVNFFVVRELLSYQTTVTTEETNEYTIDGEENTFNQYNDNAIHNENKGVETGLDGD